MANIALYSFNVNPRAVYSNPTASSSAVLMAGVGFGFPDGRTRISLAGTATDTPVWPYTHFSAPYNGQTVFFRINSAQWINSSCWEITYSLDGAQSGWYLFKNNIINMGKAVIVRSTDPAIVNKWFPDPEFPTLGTVTRTAPGVTALGPQIVLTVAAGTASGYAASGLSSYVIDASDYQQLCINLAADPNNSDAKLQQSYIKGIYLMTGISSLGTAGDVTYLKPDGTRGSFGLVSAKPITGTARTSCTMATSGADFTATSPIIERLIYIPTLGLYHLQTAGEAVTTSCGITIIPDPANGVTRAFMNIDSVTREDLPMGTRSAPTLPIISSDLSVMRIENDIALKQADTQMVMSMIGAANPVSVATGGEGAGAASFASAGLGALSAVGSRAMVGYNLNYAYQQRAAAAAANINGGGGGDITSIVSWGAAFTRGTFSSFSDYIAAKGGISGKAVSISDITLSSTHWIELDMTGVACGPILASRIASGFSDGIYPAN